MDTITSLFSNQFVIDAVLACLLLSVLLGYFGIHIVKRRIVFIDLAIAQSIALGTVIASLWESQSFLVTLIVAFVSINVLFALSMIKKIPQEALIGLLYAGSSALALLIVAKSPHGETDIMRIFFGNILTINYTDLYILIAIGIIVAIVHRYMWVQFVEILETGADNKFANYIFYLTLGLVIAFSIKIAGVLLIFTYLIASAISGISWFRSRIKLIVFSVLFNVIGSITGIALSYILDLPTGATIVCVLIGMVVIISMIKVIKDNRIKT